VDVCSSHCVAHTSAPEGLRPLLAKGPARLPSTAATHNPATHSLTECLCRFIHLNSAYSARIDCQQQQQPHACPVSHPDFVKGQLPWQDLKGAITCQHNLTDSPVLCTCAKQTRSPCLYCPQHGRQCMRSTTTHRFGAKCGEHRGAYQRMWCRSHGQVDSRNAHHYHASQGCAPYRYLQGRHSCLVP
jgi:hypothetical protein